MKRLLLIIILTFSLQTWIKADDISDLQIEGLSIGDSLLNFASEEVIENYRYKNQSSKNKYIIIEADKFIKINQYDYLGVSVKKNDPKYIITSISGRMYSDNLSECKKLRKLIIKDIKKIIKFDSSDKSKYKSQDGRATVHAIQLYLKPYPSVESIVINCIQYSKQSNTKNNLSVSINSEKYAYYLINNAYN
tara:strand:- start:10833 stop:11408 length:576 start_codon:yes stop_codon:yes gene_type:complete